MRLPEEDIDLFYKLYPTLLFYTNERRGIMRDVATVDEFMQLPIEEIHKVREALYEYPELIDSFVNENSFAFSQEELEIVRSWKHFIKARFFLFRYLKKYAIFLDEGSPPKAYGVLALRSDLQEMAGWARLPVFLDAVLLPFKDKIIHDGIIIPYSINFGSGIRHDLNAAYQETKAIFGIITSLPWAQKPESDVERLKSYMSSEAARDRYWSEIEMLIEKDSQLLTVYHQEMGKVHARTYGRRLSKIGLRNAWFAILEGEIVAGGSTKTEVERVLDGFIPAEKRDFVYLFRVKGSKVKR